MPGLAAGGLTVAAAAAAAAAAVTPWPAAQDEVTLILNIVKEMAAARWNLSAGDDRWCVTWA
jgi:hypothetical protein